MDVTSENEKKTHEDVETNTFPIPFALGEIKEDISISTDTLGSLSKEKIINQAFKFHSIGNILEAAKYYHYFIDQGFNDHRVFSNYGIISKTLGDLKKAEILQRKAIELKPDYAEAHSNLGIILSGLGNLKEAELSMRKAIELNPQLEMAHCNLGVILKDLGKLKEAEISQRKAIELKPDYAEAYSNLGIILSNLGKLKEAELSTQKAIELNPNFSNAYYTLGTILKNLGQLKEAQVSFEKAIKLKIGYIEAHNALTSVLEELGRKEEAEDSSKKVMYLKSANYPNFKSENNVQNNLTLNKPSQIEYSTFYRPGMGTENLGGFLRSMVMMLRPKRILEIGAGYTTPFLLEGLINNERVFDDGNLMESYFQDYSYEAKLVVIDNLSQGELTKIAGMENIISSPYTEFIEGDFQGKSKVLFKKYGNFDFVWFDCGAADEYLSFFQEFWEYCSDYIFFHNTYSEGRPNNLHKIIQDKVKGNPAIFDIVEQHKKRQGSITMVNKKYKFQS